MNVVLNSYIFFNKFPAYEEFESGQADEFVCMVFENGPMLLKKDAFEVDDLEKRFIESCVFVELY